MQKVGLGVCACNSGAREAETRGSLELTGQLALPGEYPPGSVGDLLSKKISQDIDLLPHALTVRHTDTDGQYIHRRIIFIKMHEVLLKDTYFLMDI